LEEGECIRDVTLIWSQAANLWLRKHNTIKNLVLIGTAWGMDFLLCSYLALFLIHGETKRLINTLILAYPFHQALQIYLMQMGRPEGYLNFYPGLTSLTVPYHDLNHFFFSGHLMFTVAFFLEYWHLGWSRMSLLALFTVIIEWFMLILTR